MLLALAICETCPQSDVDDMINVILNIFDTRGTLVALLKAMIDREVAATSKLQLRANALYAHYHNTPQWTKPPYSEGIQCVRGFFPLLPGYMGTTT